MTQLLPPKKEVALALLERSNVDVYLDPRAKGVVVPPQFRKEPRLILKIGLNMPVPIPDLRLDDESMSCTLSFNRAAFYCVVPWPCVFAMVGEDGRGMVWPDDVPQELAVKVVEPGDASPGGPVPADRESQAGPSARSRGKKGSSPGGAGAGAPAQLSLDGGDAARSSPKKGGKKKKDEGRPVLVAVGGTSHEARLAREANGGKEKDKEKENGGTKEGNGKEKSRTPSSRRPPEAQPAAASAPESSPAPASSRTPGPEADDVVARPAAPATRTPAPSPPSNRPGMGPRPKRELPPYLRVVK